MLPRRTDYSGVLINWDPDARRFVVRPKYPDQSITPLIGLGNAAIQFNMDHPPQTVVAPITGEADTANGLAPHSFFPLHSPIVAAKNVAYRENVHITGLNGGADISFYEADSTVVLDSVKDAGVIGNGCNSKRGFIHGSVDGQYWRLDTVMGFFPDGVSGTKVAVVSGGYGAKYVHALASDGSIKIVAIDPNGATHLVTNEEVLEPIMSRVDNGCKIVEIAGSKNTLKVRLDDGRLMNFIYSGADPTAVYVGTVRDIGRVTRNGEYRYKGEYYHSGHGDAPIYPLLEGNILYVMEAGSTDIVVKIDNRPGDTLATIRGVDFVLMDDGRIGVHTPSGLSPVLSISDFAMQMKIPGEPYSACPECCYGLSGPQESYLKSIGIECVHSSWSGEGATGHVVAGHVADFSYRERPTGYMRQVSALIVSTEAGNLILKNGALEPLADHTQVISGADLVAALYQHTLSDDKIPVTSNDGVFTSHAVGDGLFLSFSEWPYEEVDPTEGE
ncbi:hypothetical protein [Nitratifractor sp.]